MKKQRIENQILTLRERISNDFDTSFFDRNTVFNFLLKYRIGGDMESKKNKRHKN